LSPPVFYKQTSEIQTTLAVTSSRFDPRRGIHSRLRPPTIVTILPPVFYKVSVKLAGRTRLEAQRRASHYKLYGPTKIRKRDKEHIRIHGKLGQAWSVGDLSSRRYLRGPGSPWSVGDPE
jgi:hypothetical protein